MARRSSHWITNVRQGARPMAVAPEQTARDMARAATQAMGAVFAGVDLIRDADGRLINASAAWPVTPLFKKRGISAGPSSMRAR